MRVVFGKCLSCNCTPATPDCQLLQWPESCASAFWMSVHAMRASAFWLESCATVLVLSGCQPTQRELVLSGYRPVEVTKIREEIVYAPHRLEGCKAFAGWASESEKATTNWLFLRYQDRWWMVNLQPRRKADAARSSPRWPTSTLRIWPFLAWAKVLFTEGGGVAQSKATHNKCYVFLR